MTFMNGLFLIELTLKNNLNIGFKPHPLQRPESKKISDRLKLKYNKINWIDENINKKLFLILVPCLEFRYMGQYCQN